MLMIDLNLEEVKYQRNKKKDGRGFYGFKLLTTRNSVEVEIPGVESDRFIEGRPWYSPRCYVDGSSWLYGYALGSIRDKLLLDN